MNNKDGWLWVPMLGIVLGIGLPPVLAHVSEDQLGGLGGMFAVFLVFVASLLAKIEQWIPAAAKWADSSIVGASVTVFCGSFLSSGAAVLFTLLPVPVWLSVVFAVALCTIAFVIFINMGNSHS